MMPDREKVIKGITNCLSHKSCSENGCPYENACGIVHLNSPLLRDVLALLKEQPEKKTGKWHGVLYLGSNKELKRCTCCDYLCNGWDIETGIAYDYCPNCGAEMQNGDTNRELERNG